MNTTALLYRVRFAAETDAAEAFDVGSEAGMIGMHFEVEGDVPTLVGSTPSHVDPEHSIQVLNRALSVTEWNWLPPRAEALGTSETA